MRYSALGWFQEIHLPEIFVDQKVKISPQKKQVINPYCGGRFDVGNLGAVDLALQCLLISVPVEGVDTGQGGQALERGPRM